MNEIVEGLIRRKVKSWIFKLILELPFFSNEVKGSEVKWLKWTCICVFGSKLSIFLNEGQKTEKFWPLEK